MQHAPPAPSKRNRLILYIIIGLVAGLALGYFLNIRLAGRSPEELDKALLPLSILPDVFLRLIKMIVGPLVLTTLIVGVARVGDLKAVGRIGGKTLLWFVSASLMSLLLGLVLVNLFQPGASLNLPLPTGESGVSKAALSLKDFITHLVPVSIFDAMARNEILQVVIFSIMFGIAAAAIGEPAQPVIKALDAIGHIILKMTGYIMKVAP